MIFYSVKRFSGDYILINITLNVRSSDLKVISGVLWYRAVRESLEAPGER